jgi:phage shock protein A
VKELERELRRLRSSHARWRERATDACSALLAALPSVDTEVLGAAERLGEILNEP